MKKNTNNIYGYDRNILIDNLKNVMNSKNIKPQDIANTGIISQPRLSECLNKSKKANFTLEQIYMIANYLDTSIDSLLCMTKSKQNTDNVTLYDVISLLFALDELEPLSIQRIEYSYSTSPYFSFNQGAIATFLNEWIDIKTARDSLDMGASLYESWKVQTLEQSKTRFKKLDYLTPDVAASVKADNLIAHYSRKHTNKLRDFAIEDINLIKNNLPYLRKQKDNFDTLLEALSFIEKNQKHTP